MTEGAPGPEAGVWSPAGRVVFFPVRHHSPAAARLVRRLARDLRPGAVLIEGPSDFNSRLPELFLPHRLPIAIYSYLRLPDGSRRGAFYPFCVYSPEWQALQAAHELGCPAEFIDLPWADLARDQLGSHLYADGELRRSRYVPQLCRTLGVEDFDALWDSLFEIDPQLSVEGYLQRAHQFCYHARTLDRDVPPVDRRREAFMAGRIRATLDRLGPARGPLLVVCGGFNAYALYARLHSLPFESGEEEAGQPPPPEAEVEERGIALTPYSYERLDSLTGYDAGMPNPGFYHAVWEARAGPDGPRVANGADEGGQRDGDGAPAYRGLLGRAVADLRARGQPISTADLIAVEALAGGLASLRGHQEIWRRDVVDGVTGALVKDEVEGGLLHPFLEALFETFRGRERGALASGTSLPPLVLDVRRRLEALDLEPPLRERVLDLDLTSAPELERSRTLHRLRVLRIRGFQRLEGTDFALREDLSRPWERWRLRWSPELEADCIEAAIYGATLEEGATGALQERARAAPPDASAAALLLLEGALMGLLEHLTGVQERLVALIRGDSRFESVTRALGHLLYLYRYDELLGAAGAPSAGALLGETYERGLWLLQRLGLGPIPTHSQVARSTWAGAPGEGAGVDTLRGVRALLDAFRACTDSAPAGADPPDPPLGFVRETLVETLRRVASGGGRGGGAGGETSDRRAGRLAGRSAALRGACAGALWALGEQDTAGLVAGLRASPGPDGMGDYLTGLFTLARETAQRDAALVAGVDDVLMGYDDETFLAALPSLRLAFSFFTPREKHHLALTLVESLSGGPVEGPLPDLEVPVEVAARALAFESRLYQRLARYGIRGGRR